MQVLLARHLDKTNLSALGSTAFLLYSTQES